MKNKPYIGMAALAALAWLAAPVQAETPTAFVKSILDRVMAIQTNPSMEGEQHVKERSQAIHQIIAASFDFPMMAKDSLGPTYGRLSSGQRAEFTRIFSRLFQDSYTRMVLNFLKKENVSYDKENLKGSEAQVNTRLMRPNETIPVNYLMHSQGGGWLLYDVIVDGVSILNDYKTQFAKTIQSNSFEFLLGKMKKQAQVLE